MATKTIKILLIITVFIFFSNIAKATDFVKLDIKIVKVHNDKIECDFLYHFDLNKNDSIQMFVCCLPFTQNPRMSHSISNNDDADLFVTCGFNKSGKGLVNINSFRKPVKFDLEFLNVEILTKPYENNKNGLKVDLDFSNKNIPEINNLHNISINEFQIIFNSDLIYSKPNFEITNENTYRLAFDDKTLENVFFVIPKSKEKQTIYILLAIFSCIIAGLFTSLGAWSFIKNKNKLAKVVLICGSVLILISIFLICFCIKKVENFWGAIALIGFISIALGIFAGIVSQSIYSLFYMSKIDKQQRG
jgi:hypothetical protein